MITSEKIAALLTELLQIDPQAMYYLNVAGAPANQAMVDHPTVTCDEPMPGVSGWMVRWLGVLQGIGAMDGHHICAVYENRRLIKFEAKTIADFDKAAEFAAVRKDN